MPPRLSRLDPRSVLLCLAAVLCSGCRPAQDTLAASSITLDASDSTFRYVGRVAETDSGAVDLLGTAAYVEFMFAGDSATLSLSTVGGPGGYSFATVEVDGEYLGRYRIGVDSIRTIVVAPGALAPGEHRLRLSQASEPWVGHLIFHAASAKTITPAAERRATVSFFGDSISAGAASDTTGMGCDEALYGDQANAFLAFPARTGRLLNLDYVVHAQSGRGLYVNWNAQDPPLPALLDHLAMDTTDTRTYELATEDPVAAVICLGTNDMNAGEARTTTPFDSTHFTEMYIAFVDRLLAAYPRAGVVLVTSPLSGPPQSLVLERILERVEQRALATHPSLRIAIANVSGYPVNGCSRVPHPSTADQALIAETVAAVVKKLL